MRQSHALLPGTRARAAGRCFALSIAIGLTIGLTIGPASADGGFAIHAEGAVAHMVGDRSDQFGWGASGAVVPELVLGRKIGLELPIGATGVSFR